MHAATGGGGGGGSGATSVPEGSSSVPGADEDTMWQMSLRAGGGGAEQVDAGPYPERDGEPDCSYYMRTGTCRFGMTCKFNHPPNRSLAVATARLKGEYPQRAGQPECQYYLKTGTCKFGATCKFHHPREKAGIIGRVQLNVLGYPLRPEETECAYYLRTGQCKFGNTCKFHHPQPSNDMIALRGSGAGATYASPQGAVTSPVYAARPGFIASPRWQGPSSYAPVILPQGMMQVPAGWNTYPAQMGSSSPDEQQRSNTYYATSRQTELGSEQQGVYQPYQPAGSLVYAVQRESVFPERPDQPECQFYMKTGDCKFGATCKFHHPRERLVPAPNCALSPIGLPLRPGEPMCDFYSRYGICKFGPNCKFDHPPMGGAYMYGHTASPQQISVGDRNNELEPSQSSS